MPWYDTYPFQKAARPKYVNDAEPPILTDEFVLTRNPAPDGTWGGSSLSITVTDNAPEFAVSNKYEFNTLQSVKVKVWGVDQTEENDENNEYNATITKGKQT